MQHMYKSSTIWTVYERHRTNTVRIHYYETCRQVPENKTCAIEVLATLQQVCRNCNCNKICTQTLHTGLFGTIPVLESYIGICIQNMLVKTVYVITITRLVDKYRRTRLVRLKYNKLCNKFVAIAIVTRLVLSVCIQVCSVRLLY